MNSVIARDAILVEQMALPSVQWSLWNPTARPKELIVSRPWLLEEHLVGVESHADIARLVKDLDIFCPASSFNKLSRTAAVVCFAPASVADQFEATGSIFPFRSAIITPTIVGVVNHDSELVFRYIEANDTAACKLFISISNICRRYA